MPVFKALFDYDDTTDDLATVSGGDWSNGSIYSGEATCVSPALTGRVLSFTAQTGVDVGTDAADQTFGYSPIITDLSSFDLALDFKLTTPSSRTAQLKVIVINDQDTLGGEILILDLTTAGVSATQARVRVVTDDTATYANFTCTRDEWHSLQMHVTRTTDPDTDGFFDIAHTVTVDGVQLFTGTHTINVAGDFQFFLFAHLIGGSGSPPTWAIRDLVAWTPETTKGAVLQWAEAQ